VAAVRSPVGRFVVCIKIVFKFMQNKASLILKRLTDYRRFSTTLH
jgi:hypothetical protein